MARPVATTTESLPGHRVVEILGIVHGRADAVQEVGKDLLSAFESLGGGGDRKRGQTFPDLRAHALGLMQDAAAEQGADAVVAVRLSAGASGVIAYGTAVRTEPA